MPTRKSRLNRAEQARYFAAMQDLHAAGLDVDIPEEWLQEAPLLDVTVATSPASVAFDLPNAGVGYAIYLRLVARQSALVLPHYQVTTKWDDEISLLNVDEHSPICRLGWMTYSRSDLLNEGLDTPLRFNYRGQMIEGTILATGLQPLPAAYRTGILVGVRLTFADSLGHEIDVEAELYVNRTAKRNTVVRLGSGLYEPLAQRETDAVLPQEDFRLLHRQHLEAGSPEEGE